MMKKKDLLKIIEVALDEKEKQKEMKSQNLSYNDIVEIVQNSGLTFEEYEKAENKIKKRKKLINTIIWVTAIIATLAAAVYTFGFLTVVIILCILFTIFAGIISGMSGS